MLNHIISYDILSYYVYRYICYIYLKSTNLVFLKSPWPKNNENRSSFRTTGGVASKAGGWSLPGYGYGFSLTQLLNHVNKPRENLWNHVNFYMNFMWINHVKSWIFKKWTLCHVNELWMNMNVKFEIMWIWTLIWTRISCLFHLSQNVLKKGDVWQRASMGPFLRLALILNAQT